jgi:hypothetical protein
VDSSLACLSSSPSTAEDDAESSSAEELVDTSAGLDEDEDEDEKAGDGARLRFCLMLQREITS